MTPLIRPAGDELVKQWLVALAMQTAGKGTTTADAQMKAAAYAMSLCDEPAFYFTTATLKAAARRFTWFPSVAEVVGFLEDELQDQRGQLKVAHRLARVTRPRAPATPDEPDRRTLADRIEDLAAAKRMFGLRPEQSLAKVIDAPAQEREAEKPKAQYIWIMPNGSRRLAETRPDGGISLAEYHARRDAR